MCGNFDIIVLDLFDIGLDHFSRIAPRYATQHTLCLGPIYIYIRR